jgi:hypothetical protein
MVCCGRINLCEECVEDIGGEKTRETSECLVLCDVIEYNEPRS